MNSQALFYYFRKHGEEVGFAASREGIFSLLATFLLARPLALPVAPGAFK